MLKRFAAIAATALAVLAGSVGLGAPAAQAAGTCTLVVPAKFSIWHQYQNLTTRGYGTCIYGNGWGGWDLIHPRGRVLTTVLSAPQPYQAFTIGSAVPLGKMTWRPYYAQDTYGAPSAQNTTYTEFRVGSWAATSASRYGNVVTIYTRAQRYAITMDRSVPWAGAVGQIQYRVPGTTTWRPLKSVTTYSNGTYTYRYTTSQVRDYRTVYVGTSTIWNYTTLTVRK